MRLALQFYCFAFILFASCSGSDMNNGPAAPTPDPEPIGNKVAIDSPVGLDDIVGLAESRVLKVSGTAEEADGQTVTLTFSDGSREVTATATVNAGAWLTDRININSLNNGQLNITASVRDVDGLLSRAELNNVMLDKTRVPPAPSRDGTIWVVNQVITDADPSALESLSAAGQGMRTMYDRRSGWVQLNAWLFGATYSNGQRIEVQVNPEFTEASALVEAQKYAEEIGRMPQVLRRDAQTVWIHKGDNPFGGGNNNYLIHTGISENTYIPRSNLEETLVHEGSHTSLDSHFKNDPDWLYAQEADGTFISEYARDNPNREDIAETFLLWMAYRYRPQSLTLAQKRFIEEAMSYRMAYFDKQNLDMSPFD